VANTLVIISRDGEIVKGCWERDNLWQNYA